MQNFIHDMIEFFSMAIKEYIAMPEYDNGMSKIE